MRAWWRTLRSRRRVAAGAGGLLAVAVAGVLVWTVTGGGPAPRARQYVAFTACLLTDAHGLAGQQSRQVWAGMQDASLKTRAKVEYLPVMSGPTEAAAMPYLASLVQRHCDVVVATGPAEVAAVNAAAARYRPVHFVVIGRAGSQSVTGIQVQAAKLRAVVARLLITAVRDSS